MKYTAIDGPVSLQGNIVPGGSLTASSFFISYSCFFEKSSRVRNVPDSGVIKRIFKSLQGRGVEIEREPNGDVIIVKAGRGRKTSLIKAALKKGSLIEEIFPLIPLLHYGYEVELSVEIYEEITPFLKIMETCGFVKKSGKQAVYLQRPLLSSEIFFDASGMDYFQISFALLSSLVDLRPVKFVNFPKDPRLDFILSAFEDHGSEILKDNDASSLGNVHLEVNMPNGSLDVEIFSSFNEVAFYSFLSTIPSSIITLSSLDTNHFLPLTAKFLSWGIQVETLRDAIKIWADDGVRQENIVLATKAYPGFNPVWGLMACVFLTGVEGNHEVAFPNLSYVKEFARELNRMEGDVRIEENELGVKLSIAGGTPLKGRKLVLDRRECFFPSLFASFSANGKSHLSNMHIFKDLYPIVFENLKGLGVLFD